MKKVTLFGLIALMVLAMAIPASASLKLGGTYTHTLKFQDQNVTTNDSGEPVIVNEMALTLTSVLAENPTDKDAKIYIELPLKMTISNKTPSIAKNGNKTWKIGYESKAFSILATDSSSAFGSFGDPLGIATSIFRDNTSLYDLGIIHNVSNVTGDGPTDAQKAVAVEEITAPKYTKGSTSNAVVVNVWGKFGRVGYKLSIGDVVLDPKVTGYSIDTLSANTTALRLTYDISSSLTVGVIGMFANQFVFPFENEIIWSDGATAGLYEHVIDESLYSGGRKHIYTLAADVVYNLAGNVKGSVFGQVALNAAHVGLYYDNTQFTAVDDMKINGVGAAVGVEDLTLGSVKLGATVVVNTPNLEATNTSGASYYTSSNASGRWPAMYLPTSLADNGIASNAGYYYSYNSKTLFVPNRIFVILSADGSWTLNNKTVIEASAKNGLTMSMNPIVDPDDSSKKTNFINNLLHLSSNFYLYGENAEGKELANKEKDVIKAGLYFDPRFVHLSNNHVNSTFNFVTRLYAGVDFKSLGLQVDLDARYGNHGSKGLEIATWASYNTAFNITDAVKVDTKVSLGYRFRTGFETLADKKFNVYNEIYGFASGKVKLANGISIDVYEALKFVTSSRKVKEQIDGTAKDVIKPQNEIVNVIRVVASKELNKIFTVSLGYTNKIWYLADRALYFGGAIEAVTTGSVKTEKGGYKSLSSTQMRNYFDAKLTAKVSPSATISITYGMTSLASDNDFSAGKDWNSYVGLAKSGSSQNVYGHKVVVDEESDTLYELYRMVWDKVSVEFKFTF